ncbi:hypothetical protein [Haloferax profundi]|uniref:Uncharacterized protein n=1 Tax=Haloferax profundi TaxID=1544718 RepID=A0A0W1RE49_9EURY|nr:hypothetical protein [Haloferax profundi]KTG11721.1 hypothetical protein AUR66_19955 [Haloferax profundi]
MIDQQTSQQQTGTKHEQDNQTKYTHGVKRRLTSLSWLARAASVGLSIVSIGFVVVFTFVLETGGDLTLITQPLQMQITLALPTVIAALTIATTVGTVLAWRHSYWSLRVRLHQTILALLGLGFCWKLATLGFLPP